MGVDRTAASLVEKGPGVTLGEKVTIIVSLVDVVPLEKRLGVTDTESVGKTIASLGERRVSLVTLERKLRGRPVVWLVETGS